MSPSSRVVRALAFARPHRAAIAVISLLTLTTGALQALEPWVFGRIFDALVPEQRIELIALLVSLLALELGREIVSSANQWLTWRTRIRLNQELLDTTITQLQRLPLRFHADQGVGEVMTRVDRGIQGLVTAMTELAFGAVPALVYLALSIGVMARLDARMTTLVLLFAPLPAIVGFLAAPEQTRRERELLDRWSRIYGRFHEVLHGILTVRSFGMEDHERVRFVRGVNETNGIVLRGLRVDTSVGLVRSVIVTGGRLAAIALGAKLVLDGETTPGTVLAFVGYIGGLFGPVQNLTGLYQTLRKARVSLDAIFDILDVPEDPPDLADPVPLALVRGAVDLEGVRFTHTPGGRWALDGIDLAIRPGERVALVGPSGAGKTTLVNLVQRLCDPTEGRVLIDGVDLRTLDQRALRRQIGVVLQDGVLFNDTIRANVAYGRPGASLDEVIEAARAANAHEFVEQLPQGYDTVIGQRGLLLSVGQRQRIAIARALLKDPPLLVLDEATSALDVETEERVQEALERLLKGRTSLTIAHRIGTIVRSDRIVVVKGGRIVAQGTHEELARDDAWYGDLVRRQIRGLAA